MWIGIVVLCTFGAAALASGIFAVRSALHRQWHLTFALALPAVVIGGVLVMMVGPVVWLEIAGNPELNSLPKDAERLTGDQLAALYADSTHTGTYYEDGAWQVFEETYQPTGNLSGSGGPSDNPERYSWRGQWKVEGDEVCFDYDTGFDCDAVYKAGDAYLVTNHRGEVTSRFEPAASDTAEESDAGSG